MCAMIFTECYNSSPDDATIYYTINYVLIPLSVIRLQKCCQFCFLCQKINLSAYSPQSYPGHPGRLQEQQLHLFLSSVTSTLSSHCSPSSSILHSLFFISHSSRPPPYLCIPFFSLPPTPFLQCPKHSSLLVLLHPVHHTVFSLSNHLSLQQTTQACFRSHPMSSTSVLMHRPCLPTS